MDDHRPFTDLHHRYPLAPLAAALDITLGHIGGHQTDQAPTGITALSEATSIPIRTLQERHHTGLDPWQADEAACAAGLHVGDVWPDWHDGTNPNAPDLPEQPSLFDHPA